MDLMIMDSAGNAVESFDSEDAAIRALIAMAESDASVATHLAILAFDAEGEAVGDPITVADVRPEAATSLVMAGEHWMHRGNLTVMWSWRAASRDSWRVAGAL